MQFFFPIKTPNPVYIKECLKCGARVSSARAVQFQFCRCWVLQGSPAAAVYPAGCGVHSWRLQSSLGQQHPPCSYNRKQERQMLNTSAGLKAVFLWADSAALLHHWMHPHPTHDHGHHSHSISAVHATKTQCSLFQKKKKKHGPSHQPAASTHCTVSLRLAGHSEDGHCRSTSCALPLSHHHMTMSTVSQLSEEDFHWAFCALARLSLSPRSCMASVELISHRTRDNSFTHLHNSTDSSTVTLPHAPEARLTADVPQLQRERVHSEDTQTMVQ